MPRPVLGDVQCGPQSLGPLSCLVQPDPDHLDGRLLNGAAPQHRPFAELVHQARLGTEIFVWEDRRTGHDEEQEGPDVPCSRRDCGRSC